MALFGFGGKTGFSAGGFLGGVGALGGAFLSHLAAREQEAAAEAERRQLQAEREAADIKARRAERSIKQQQRMEVGAMRARLAGQGVDISQGSGARLISLTQGRYDEDLSDQEALRRLEERGFRSALKSAKTRQGLAGISGFAAPAVSLLSYLEGAR